MMSMNASAIAHYKSAERALWTRFGNAPKERFLELQRPRLRARVQELGEGPTTLFLHGSPNAGSVWAPLAARLPELNCLLLDRPGCGLSEACDYRSGSLRSLAVDVIDSTLDELGVERAALVCGSLGGLWGFWYALARPARVTKLIQLSCPAGIDGGRVPLFLRLLSVPGLNRMLFALQPPSIKSTRAIIQQVCGQNLALVSSAIIDWGTCLYARTDTLQNELRLIEQLADLRGFKAQCRLSDDEIAGIAVPTLFVWANNDPFGNAELGRRLAHRMPAASLQILESGGHLPWLDDPAVCAEHILEFLT